MTALLEVSTHQNLCLWVDQIRIESEVNSRRMLTQFIDWIYADSPCFGSDEFYRQCLTEIELEHVAPQVLSILRQNQKIDCVPKDFVEALQHLYRKTAGQNLYIRFYQQQVFAALEQNGIYAIPLKGVVFAERYFGSFTSRPTSDIDILVTRDTLTRAIECLRLLGFTGPYEFNPIHFHCVMAKPIYPGGIVLYIELHWSLLHENTALPEWDRFWQNATSFEGYEYIKELTLQDTFYSICLHGANHKLESLKYLLDVAHLIYTRGTEIDFDRLLEVGKRDKTLRRVKAVLNIVYNEFPSLHQCKPLPYRISNSKWLDRAVLNARVLTPDSWGLRFRVAKEWLWPMREVALWHLRSDPGVTSTNVYRRFYRQRLIHLARTVYPSNKTSEENELHV